MDLGNLIGMLAATELVEVDGLTIGYHRAGFGPPLVLLHGYVGDGLATWRPQIEGLSDELTVIAWDAPGAGRSSDPPDQFGMAGYALGILATFLLEEIASRRAGNRPTVEIRDRG